MSSNSTVVVGVIYPGVEKFLDDYIDSLKCQTFKAFDLVIINDGADECLKQLFPEGTKWISLDETLTIASVRQLALDYCMTRYLYLIFSDTDDFYSENRVEESVRWLATYDFVFNDLTLVNSDGQEIQKAYLASLNTENEIVGFHQLSDSNVVGLSNSAIRLDKVADLTIPSDLVAVDWWLFSALVIKGCKGKFLKDSITFYRQHQSNTAGLVSKLTEARLKGGIKVKRLHYSNLARYCASIGQESLQRELEGKEREMSRLEELTQSPEECKRYIEQLNARFKELHKGWWSEIVSQERLNIYEQ